MARARLVPVAAATWLVALLTTLAPTSAPVWAAALWAAVVVVLALLPLSRSRRIRLAGAVVVLMLAGAAVAASHVVIAQPARAAAQAQWFGGGRAIEIEATVTGKIERRVDGSLAFDAVAHMVAVGEAIRDVGFEIEVRVDPESVDVAPGAKRAAPRALDVGARVLIRGTARLADAGERAVLDVSAGRGLLVVRAPDGPLGASASLRQGLLAATATLPAPGAGLVAGLAVGDTWAVAPELDAAMKASSLTHLTAVSGANCALVVGLGFAAAAALGAGRTGRVATGMVVLAGFVMLVTPEPSVVRAAAMGAIAMVAVALARAAAGLAVLCLALTLCLVLDPWLSGSLGFALSAVATAALLLTARPLAAGLTRWMPRPVAMGISVPLAAQLACGPLLIAIAPTVPVYGVVANMLAAPAAPLVTVIGLAACLSAPFPWLQAGLAVLAWLPAAWIAGVAQTVATLPGGLLPWPEGIGGIALLAVVGAAVGIVIAVPATARAPRAVRACAAVMLAVALGWSGGTAALGGIAGRLTMPADWRIAACDVGQGDAVLVRADDRIALFDTGPDPALLAACLSRVGVDWIDLLILTHFDLDHVGGVDAVRGSVGTVLHTPPADDSERALIADLVAEGAVAVPASAGMRGTLAEASWTVLWPRPGNVAFAGNDASVILDVRGGGIPPMLLLGDLSASSQRALIASGALRPPYAVVKVAHHGSADQEAELYRIAAARLALVTVGVDNDYDHPREQTLATLSEVATRIARTDLDGMVLVLSSEASLSVWRERGGVGGAG